MLTALTSCGGGATPLAAKLSIVEVSLVDQLDRPVSDLNSTAVPRNVRIRIEFSKPIDPRSVTSQSVRLRDGPDFAQVVESSMHVDGNIVRVDPTLLEDGTRSPFGMAAFADHLLTVHTVEDTDAVVRSIDDDPLVRGTEVSFRTGKGYLRELEPPRVLGVRFSPPPDFTGNVSANAVLVVEFSEPMQPASFILDRDTPSPRATIDVRYREGVPINENGGVGGRVIPGSISWSRDGTTYSFRPFFSFGTQKFAFDVSLATGLSDLAGNGLINPKSFGAFVCDGSGTTEGTVLDEDFFGQDDHDGLNSDIDWGSAEPGVGRGAPISTRNAYIAGYQFTDRDAGMQMTDSGRGQYVPDANPLMGATINQVLPNLVPASSLGRRVMWAFSDEELGAAGSITGLAWGPDSNATYASSYPNVRIQVGYKRTTDLQLDAVFSSNYRETPVELYSGPYEVAQRADIGNTLGEPEFAHKPGYGSANFQPCNMAVDWNKPLFDWSGYEPWPEFQSNFDWIPGDPLVANDEALVLDIQVAEGNNYQTQRSWFGMTQPCSGVPIAGFPQRRMYTIANSDFPNPAAMQGGQNPVLNPDPAVSDTCFTITRHKSWAQSLFYAPAGDALVASGGATFGADSDYLTPTISPSAQEAGAELIVEFQGATAVESDRRTITESQAFTPWTSDIDDCDGMPYIRWRIRLLGNLVTGDAGRVTRVQIPVRDASAGP